ncbi:hypothetical protein WMY93_014273 [Mugilogobius chulae]|uniref:Ig-like domain-containing protein n=1 Tax=Mugilogobius chulae TaxID=88201 RepID=A0AAW0NWH2_9GOBI
MPPFLDPLHGPKTARVSGCRPVPLSSGRRAASLIHVHIHVYTVLPGLQLICQSQYIPVTLNVTPHGSQFHTLQHFTIGCPSEAWTVVRITQAKGTPESCGDPWGTPQDAGCKVGPAMGSDSGLYRCQNNQSQCSPAVNITVSKEKVVLQSPPFPSAEGDKVTLKCLFRNRNHEKPTSDFRASFFRNSDFVGQFPGGEMVLEHVYKEHEGLYHCEHPTKAKSLQSLLSVKEKDAPVTPAPHESKEKLLHRILISLGLFLLYTVILCISISIYCKCARARAEQKQPKQQSELVSLRRR